VSSFEVEEELLRTSGIAEAAVVAAPSEHVEDDIMAYLVLEEAISIDLPALVADLALRLPYYMVPRYYEVVDELPRTPTFKVRKDELRRRGVREVTWDAEAAGLFVTRSGVVRR
jgi:crotonobetaine/carnitine-CoA ligase